MEIRFTDSFQRDYRTLPNNLKERLDKKLMLLLVHFRAPSLRAKKMEGYANVWECRISRGYRFTFKIVGQTYFLRRAGPHDILRKP